MEALYVASTRGRHRTTWYTATDQPTDLDCTTEPQQPQTARELLTAVLARRTGQDSARDTIRETLETASSLPSLTSLYQHAWSTAAHDLLRHAAQPLPASMNTVLVDGPGSSHLARALALAAARGADPRRVLADAVGLDTLDPVDLAHSPALVVADRIRDHQRRPGIPTTSPAEPPLSGLPPPDVGLPAWLPYLRERARLIGARADELGSPADPRREPHGMPGPLHEAQRDGLSFSSPTRERGHVALTQRAGSDRQVAHGRRLTTEQPQSRPEPRGPYLGR